MYMSLVLLYMRHVFETLSDPRRIYRMLSTRTYCMKLQSIFFAIAHTTVQSRLGFAIDVDDNAASINSTISLQCDTLLDV